jgi:hypothetical protein
MLWQLNDNDSVGVNEYGLESYNELFVPWPMWVNALGYGHVCISNLE